MVGSSQHVAVGMLHFVSIVYVSRQVLRKARSLGPRFLERKCLQSYDSQTWLP